MKKTYLILLLLLTSSFAIIPIIPASSSSSGDDSTPPPAGGGGGGGGGPQFYDYYIPLVFGENSTQGLSEVVVWVIQPSALIASFAVNSLGSTAMQVREPTKLVFNPRDNDGLTNGSLIRLTSPALVIGQRATEDINSDQSFAYSILPKRMMGFEYYAPFKGSLNLFTLNADNQVRVSRNGEVVTTKSVDINTLITTVNVQKGDYINSSQPTVGAFISYQQGTSASMAVPRYLHGNLYRFDPNMFNLRDGEIDRSTITVNPTEPTELTFLYDNNSTRTLDIFGQTTFDLSSDLRGIIARRGDIEVNIRNRITYGTKTRVSTLQLMAGPEMRAAEVFATPANLTTLMTPINSTITYGTTRYNPQNQSYYDGYHSTITKHVPNTISYNSHYDTQFVVGDDFSFSYVVSSGKTGHPMSPSMAFVNIPLNGRSQKNISGLESTWFRFTNLAVDSVEIIPGPVEEFTAPTIIIEIVSNGSLPSSAFKIEIAIDGEIEIEEEFDFLQVGETVRYTIRKFLSFRKQLLSIEVKVDADNEVNELFEDDNSFEQEYDVQPNIRLRWSIYGIIIFFLVYVVYQTRKWLKQKKKVERAHVDAIINFEQPEDLEENEEE